MAGRIKFRGGTTAEHSTFVGSDREITVDTTKKTLVLHDGVIAGGHEMARQSNVDLKADKSDTYTKSQVDAKVSQVDAKIDTEKGRIDAILSASDADKDSFKEIVDLINSVDTTNDNAFAGYVLSNNAAVALKAPLDSPAFTGSPILPTGATGVTQAVGTNNTKLATTAFVNTEIANDAVLKTNDTGGAKLPKGSTAQRPTGTALELEGLIRYNSETLGFEGYINGGWDDLGGGELDISGLPSKTTPTGDDSFVIADSVSGNALKNVTLTNLVDKIAGTTAGGLNDSNGVMSFYPYGLTTATTELTTSDFVVVSDSAVPKKITIADFANELPLLGVGQTWQDMTASMASGVTYTNSTGKPIIVSVSVIWYNANGVYDTLSVDGIVVAKSGTDNSSTTTSITQMTAIVPNGSNYSVYSRIGTIKNWSELR